MAFLVQTTEFSARGPLLSESTQTTHLLTVLRRQCCLRWSHRIGSFLRGCIWHMWACSRLAGRTRLRNVSFFLLWPIAICIMRCRGGGNIGIRSECDMYYIIYCVHTELVEGATPKNTTVCSATKKCNHRGQGVNIRLWGCLYIITSTRCYTCCLKHAMRYLSCVWFAAMCNVWETLVMLIASYGITCIATHGIDNIMVRKIRLLPNQHNT
jgi:hypothetical protein